MIAVEKQKKLQHLKHYLGGPAMAFDENHAATGQLEQLDLEDGMVCIRSENESHWFDLSIVDTNLKGFKNLTVDDVMDLVEVMIFDGEKIHRSEVISIQQQKGTDIFVYLLDDATVHINNMWWVHKDKTPVDNIGEIILSLCDMGFDVRNNG